MPRLKMLLCAITMAPSLGMAADFLTPDQYGPAALLLPAPPANDSEAGKAQLAELQRIEKTRTPERLAQARRDDMTQGPMMFVEVMGPGFDFAKLPATSKVLADAQAEGSKVTGAAKTLFKRDRPWIVDPALDNCLRNQPPQSSYPSGHATTAYSVGVILAHLVPSKGQAILARSADFAESRLICGMHFRGDIIAGQVVGTTVAMELLNNPAFKAELDAAVLELRAAKITP